MTFLSLPIVVDAVVKASVILGTTALAALVLRRASASARHLVWTLGLVSVLGVPVLSLALPRWELPIVTVAAPAQAASDFVTPADALRVTTGRSHVSQGVGHG